MRLAIEFYTNNRSKRTKVGNNVPGYIILAAISSIRGCINFPTKLLSTLKKIGIHSTNSRISSNSYIQHLRNSDDSSYADLNSFIKEWFVFT